MHTSTQLPSITSLHPPPPQHAEEDWPPPTVHIGEDPPPALRRLQLSEHPSCQARRHKLAQPRPGPQHRRLRQGRKLGVPLQKLRHHAIVFAGGDGARRVDDARAGGGLEAAVECLCARVCVGGRKEMDGWMDGWVPPPSVSVPKARTAAPRRGARAERSPAASSAPGPTPPPSPCPSGPSAAPTRRGRPIKYGRRPAVCGERERCGVSHLGTRRLAGKARVTTHAHTHTRPSNPRTCQCRACPNHLAASCAMIRTIGPSPSPAMEREDGGK